MQGLRSRAVRAVSVQPSWACGPYGFVPGRLTRPRRPVGIVDRLHRGGSVNNRRARTVAAAVTGCWLIVAPAQDSPDDKAKQMVDGLCNSCHPLAARIGTGYDDKGWHTVLRMMTNHGLALQQDQLDTMTAYLIKTYPIKGRPDAVLVKGPLN